MQIDSKIEHLVSESWRTRLAAMEDTAWILDEKLCLRGFNQAWTRFALDNEGSALLKICCLGSPLLKFISSDLRGKYEKYYLSILGSETEQSFDYHCSSSTMYREFRQTIYPMSGGCCLIVTNHRRVERPQAEKALPFSEQYRSESGFIVQCSNCRKVRNPGSGEQWDWVPSLLAVSYNSQINHTLCPACQLHYYGKIFTMQSHT